MNDRPLYISKRTVKSLGQEYRIYPNRLELQAWVLLHTMVVPAIVRFKAADLYVSKSHPARVKLESDIAGKIGGAG